MKNRLEAARELLREDGAIFISCDDNECFYLKILIDEIWGRENFKANFIWHHRKSSQNDIDVSLAHNYILCYAKDINQFNFNSLNINDDKFSNPDNDPKGAWVADPFDAPNIRPNLTYPIKNPLTGEQHLPPSGRCWRFSQEKFASALTEGRIIFGKTGKGRPLYKRYKFEAEEKGTNPFTLWDDVSTATNATHEIMKLFNGQKVFSTPKPENLLERIINISSKENDIVLDYHLGSGTTVAVAHKMDRQYIGVEQMEYIENITIERLRKVIKGEQGGISETVGWQGGGSFVYCELAQDNERFVKLLQKAQTAQDLANIWTAMQEQAFLSYRVDVKTINENINDFQKLSLADQKRFLLETLDKNLLYINYCDIDDADYKISAEDRKLNRDFFKAV
jgi:adenine-specific DNA-methyltransferase